MRPRSRPRPAGDDWTSWGPVDDCPRIAAGRPLMCDQCFIEALYSAADPDTEFSCARQRTFAALIAARPQVQWSSLTVPGLPGDEFH